MIRNSMASDRLATVLGAPACPGPRGLWPVANASDGPCRPEVIAAQLADCAELGLRVGGR
jgi:hypothetical protein